MKKTKIRLKMKLFGPILKMKSENFRPIKYYLSLNGHFLCMHQHIGKNISIKYLHYECLGCGNDKEIYRQGFCKNCFFSLPQANPSILRPELSTSHLGIVQRDLEWEKAFEIQPHIVYLSVTSHVKVGVTHEKQLLDRWIDQGALSAITLARTPNRYLAGLIEVVIKKKVSDKTYYQKMLTNIYPKVHLREIKSSLYEFLPEETQKYFLKKNNDIYTFTYPVEHYPKRIKNIHLKKTPDLNKKLIGIKGQYWIFEDQSVLNIRAHEGFYVSIEIF